MMNYALFPVLLVEFYSEVYIACRPEDLRAPFGEFGPLKDVYLPRDYYTG